MFSIDKKSDYNEQGTSSTLKPIQMSKTDPVHNKKKAITFDLPENHN